VTGKEEQKGKNDLPTVKERSTSEKMETRAPVHVPVQAHCRAALGIFLELGIWNFAGLARLSNPNIFCHSDPFQPVRGGGIPPKPAPKIQNSKFQTQTNL
jgi:hypothetical protein